MGARPVQQGARHQHPHQDQQGAELGDLRRRRNQARVHPRRHGPPAGPPARPAAGPQAGDGLDRGPELLQPRRHRSVGHHPRRRAGPPGRRQARAGRLDDHPAARPQPLPHRAGRHHPAQDHRGAPGQRPRGGARQGLDPRQVPEHRAVRDQQRLHGHRRPGGRRDLLLQAGEGPEPSRGRAHRGPSAGALRLQPVQQPPGGSSAPQRGPPGDGEPGLHHEHAVLQRDPLAARPASERPVLEDQAAADLRPGPAAARRQVRRQHRALRRPQGLHDHPAACRPRRRRRRQLLRRVLGRPIRADRRARLDRPEDRRDRGPRLLELLPVATTSSTSPRRRTASRARRSRPTC